MLLKRGYSAEFADSNQNHKIIGTPNQAIRMNIFPKNIFSYKNIGNEQKTHMGAT
jgi:hypothetical protein